MKIIKYLFFLFLIVIIAGAIYIATQDGDYHVEETTLVNAPVPVVFNEVNNYTNWENWGPWRKGSNEVIIDYNDKTQGEGGGYSWKSHDLGDGYITSTKVYPDKAIEQEIVHNPTFAESNGEMYWNFEEAAEGTTVTVGIKGNHSFKEKLAFALRDKTFTEEFKPRLSQSLENLNRGLQEKMSLYTINVDGETTHGGGFYMYTTTSTKISQVPEQMQKMLKELKNYMEANNITQQGDPFVLYNNLDEQNNTAIYSAGIFTPSIVITPADSEVLNGMMPVQRVVKTTLKGDYKNLEEAWDKAYQYLEENNIKANEERQPFEVYKTDPETVQNPANRVTEIFIPIHDNRGIPQF